jgi:hypothetical protein
MKMLPILSAAFIAAGCTLALAQGDNAAKPGTGADADKNPTGTNANPAAGNPAGAPNAGTGKTTMSGKPKKSASAKHKRHAKAREPADGGAK